MAPSLDSLLESDRSAELKVNSGVTIVTKNSLETTKDDGNGVKTKRGGKKPGKGDSLGSALDRMNDSCSSDFDFDADTCIGTVDSRDVQAKQQGRVKRGARRPGKE